MTEKNYFDLTNEKNELSDLKIVKKDNFECQILDSQNNYYDGFKLASSKKNNVFTLCDINFHISTDNKYQARLTFRKIDSNLKNKKIRSDINQIIIPFDSGKNGYRNFWRMIEFLYQWREELDLGHFENLFSVVTDKDLAAILPQIANINNKEGVLKNLEILSKKDLTNISNLVDITNLKRVLSKWEENNDNDSEEFWQDFFEEDSFILSQIFACPFVKVGQKYYCGGKDDNNRGGVEGDFLYQNPTLNVAFIEIKTPLTKIVGNQYRGKEPNKANTIFSMDSQLTGAINQVLNQRKEYTKKYVEKNGRLLDNPKCVLIIGNLPQNSDEKKSFELYRSSLKNVEIITFDELFERIKSMLSLFEESV